MVKQLEKVGKMPPLYNFSLNPYPELRFSHCPNCGYPTGQRKLPLFIFVEPSFKLVLGMTCRYCKQCDTLICHKDIFEHLLTTFFEQYDPIVIGNEYIIVGTVEKKIWREGLTTPRPASEMVEQLHDFRNYEELRMTQKGWYPAGYEPPVWDPPPSMEWIKQ
jgi:hypothetical protein